MKCVFNKTTKKFTGTAIRWDTPETAIDEIIIDLPNIPDNTVRLNNTEDGIRPVTQTEINEEKAIEKADQVEAELGGDNIRVLVDVFKQIVMDGTISTKTPDEIIAQAKSMRRAEL